MRKADNQIKGDVDFLEIQKFHKIGIIALLVFVLTIPFIVFSYLWINQVLLENPNFSRVFGNDTLAFLLIFSFVLIIIAFRYSLFIDLTVYTNHKSIFVKFSPIHSHFMKVDIKDITNISVVEVHSISGLGLSSLFNKSKLEYEFIVNNKHAICLDLNSGKKIYIGSSRINELKRIIEHYLLKDC